jgi:hypothetical protein
MTDHKILLLLKRDTYYLLDGWNMHYKKIVFNFHRIDNGHEVCEEKGCLIRIVDRGGSFLYAAKMHQSWKTLEERGQLEMT